MHVSCEFLQRYVDAGFSTFQATWSVTRSLHWRLVKDNWLVTPLDAVRGRQDDFIRMSPVHGSNNIEHKNITWYYVFVFNGISLLCRMIRRGTSVKVQAHPLSLRRPKKVI